MVNCFRIKVKLWNNSDTSIQKRIEKVVFPVVIIRLDNTQAISKLTKFLINPNLNHIKAVDHNIYYLVSKKYLTIEYKAENKNSKLITITNKIFTVAADASYRNNPDRISEKEYIFKLFKDVINQSLNKQLIVIIFITEAELLRISYTTKTFFQ